MRLSKMTEVKAKIGLDSGGRVWYPEGAMSAPEAQTVPAGQTLEARYGFAYAAEIIPLRNVQALYNLLHKHKDIQPLYSHGRRGLATLTLAQIIELRNRYYTTEHRRVGAPKGAGRPRSSKQPTTKPKSWGHPLTNKVMRQL